jgi:hypothetical protein
MDFKNISILIPYKPDNGFRDRNWAWVKQRWEQIMPDAELCMGYYNYEPYKKAQAVNNAARLATREIFIIADADIVVDLDDLITGLSLLSKHPWVIPFSDNHRLTSESTDQLLKQDCTIALKNFEYSTEFIYNYRITAAYSVGSILMLPRSAFEKVGGFDIRFRGWGYEDDGFQLSMDTLWGPHVRSDNIVYHLWHPTAKINDFLYKKNTALYNDYMQASGNKAAMQALVSRRSYHSIKAQPGVRIQQKTIRITPS